MVGDDEQQIDPPGEGGAEPVTPDPPDTAGKGSGPAMVLVVILAILALAMPVAWGIGALATVGDAVGGAALVMLWIVWAIVVLLFLGSLWAMWRRAA